MLRIPYNKFQYVLAILIFHQNLLFFLKMKNFKKCSDRNREIPPPPLHPRFSVIQVVGMLRRCRVRSREAGGAARGHPGPRSRRLMATHMSQHAPSVIPSHYARQGGRRTAPGGPRVPKSFTERFGQHSTVILNIRVFKKIHCYLIGVHSLPNY